MKIYDMPVEWQEDYNTTVKVWKTIKNYLIQMYHLKRHFVRKTNSENKRLRYKTGRMERENYAQKN